MHPHRPPPPASRYASLLTDPRWRHLRLQVLNRDRFRCRSCPPDAPHDRPLHVHHTQYISGRLPWQYPMRMLVTLCSQCHHELHGRPARIAPDPKQLALF